MYPIYSGISPCIKQLLSILYRRVEFNNLGSNHSISSNGGKPVNTHSTFMDFKSLSGGKVDPPPVKSLILLKVEKESKIN